MSITTEYPFTTPENYTYDPDKIVISGGVAKLQPVDVAGLTFTEDFTDDTGFTYDSTKTAISGTLSQIDKLVPNSTAWATYTTDENLNYGGGTLAGTLTGGAVSGGWLDLTGGSGLKYIDYSATSNFDRQQIIVLKFIIKPDYSGSPSTIQNIFSITKAVSDTTNMLQLSQRTNGQLRIAIHDSSDVQQFNNDYGAWSPTSGQEYEVEVNIYLSKTVSFDTEVRIFIDGTQFGSVGTSFTCTRDANIGLARFGASAITSNNADFSIKDIIAFQTIQHTTNYTPGYTLPEARYLGDVITLPAFTYPFAGKTGDIQAFTNFTVTDTNTPKYTIDSKWYSGGWTTSNNTYAQANTEAEILANIATLPVTNTPLTRLITNNGVSQMTADNLVLTYTGQQYLSTESLTIKDTIRLDGLEGFTETSTVQFNDKIKYILKKRGTEYWWDGAAWSESDGTYSQSNLASEIETNKASFTSVGTVLQIIVFLHASPGSTAITPELDLLQVAYDFFGEDNDDIDKCIVWGYSFNDDGTVNRAKIKAELSISAVQYKTNITIIKKTVSATPDINGYWEMELVETDNMSNTPTYTFLINEKDYNRNVPNQQNANFWDLT
jgi:hypothetical protein